RACSPSTRTRSKSRRPRNACHPRESGGPVLLKWIPAFAGMTMLLAVLAPAARLAAAALATLAVRFLAGIRDRRGARLRHALALERFVLALVLDRFACHVHLLAM